MRLQQALTRFTTATSAIQAKFAETLNARLARSGGPAVTQQPRRASADLRCSGDMDRHDGEYHC
jgi:hypothetical protein